MHSKELLLYGDYKGDYGLRQEFKRMLVSSVKLFGTYPKALWPLL